MSIQFLSTKVYHQRLLPHKHVLNHDIFYYMIDLDDLKDFDNYACSSYNRFNIWSLYSKDYGFDGDGLNPQRFQDIKTHYHIPDGKICLITIPRFFGHSFNPVSFFLFYNIDQKLVAVLSEVHNTFGERHCYICQHQDHRPIEKDDTLQATKIFHVSPFFPVSGYYEFKFDIASEKIAIKIDYFNEKGEKLLVTGINALSEKLKKNKPISLAIRFPFIGIKIILLIHYHAALLWLKKTQFFKKPPPPSQQISS